jgi:hypothetical protein
MKQLGNVVCVLSLVLFSGLAARPAIARAGPDKSRADWDKVKQLPAGQEILVVQNDTKSLQGKLQSASDETVVIRLATGEQTIAKGSILRVSSRGASHSLRNTALVAGAGFGGGAGIGAAAGNPNGMFGRGPTALVGAAIGLLSGAAVGAVLPTGSWHEVYRTQ